MTLEADVMRAVAAGRTIDVRLPAKGVRLERIKTAHKVLVKRQKATGLAGPKYEKLASQREELMRLLSIKAQREREDAALNLKIIVQRMEIDTTS